MQDNRGYFSRSWALLTKDKGWYKPVLVMAVALLVPIAGPLGVSGYILEWNRLVAWGYDAAPKQKNVRVGECITSGWRGFVSTIGWSALWLLICMFLMKASNNNDLVSLLLTVVGFFVGPFIYICEIRASIYQNFKAGYRIDRIKDMLAADFTGFARITGLMFVMELVVGLVLGLLLALTIIPTAIGIIFEVGYASSEQMISQIMATLGAAAIPLVIIVIVALVCGTVLEMLSQTAVALWMRQFDVARWGASGDPLPPRGTGIPGLPEVSVNVTPQNTQPQVGATPQNTQHPTDVASQDTQPPSNEAPRE